MGKCQKKGHQVPIGLNIVNILCHILRLFFVVVFVVFVVKPDQQSMKCVLIIRW